MKAKIVPLNISVGGLVERFRKWLSSTGGRPTSRSVGAGFLIFSLGFIFLLQVAVPGVALPALFANLMFGVIGAAGTVYATGEGNTWSGPVGSVRAMIVLACFIYLFLGPNLGERPLLFEAVAVAFGRSLKE